MDENEERGEPGGDGILADTLFEDPSCQPGPEFSSPQNPEVVPKTYANDRHLADTTG